MKCEKCGYINSEYDIICEKCGSPLSIEKNIELQKKYNHKQRAIDIEEITPDNSKIEFADTKRKVRTMLAIIFAVVVVLILVVAVGLFKEVRANDVMYKFEDIYENKETGLIYIGNNDYLNNLYEQYSEDYNFNYLNVNKVTGVKKKKIKNILELNSMSSTLVITKKGEVLNVMYDCDKDNEKKQYSLLKEYDLVPYMVGNHNSEIAKFEKAIKSVDSAIIYFSNKKKDDSKNELIKTFAEDYSINYYYIDGNYLTTRQSEKLLSKINYSTVKEEMLIIIDDAKVLDVFYDLPKDKKSYFEIASKYGIIDVSSASSLKAVNYNEMKKLVSSKNKEVILLVTDNCTYCDRAKPILGKISIQNNFKIHYYKYSDKNSLKVEEYLSNIGYGNNSLTSPLLIITQNGKILDYVIGLSDKSLYEQKFKDLGVY